MSDEALEMLRRLEWSGCDGEPYGGCSSVCPECGERGPRQEHRISPRIGINKTDEPMTIVHPKGEHAADCKLAALLRTTSPLPSEPK